MTFCNEPAIILKLSNNPIQQIYMKVSKEIIIIETDTLLVLCKTDFRPNEINP
jgi:hypothetical protein